MNLNEKNADDYWHIPRISKIRSPVFQVATYRNTRKNVSCRMIAHYNEQ